MELPVIVHELRTLNEEYKKRLTDKEPATEIYCNGFCAILQKFLDKHDGSYEEYVFSLCIFLCHYAASYGELAIDNAKEKICQQLFRLCIKAVLDVKWKELSGDNTCRQKFRETVEAVHTQLERFDFYQFHLIKGLMETHWNNPTLSRIIAGDDDLEEQEVMEYFAEEDPIVLKVRVEMLLDENCEEFGLNLCRWCCLHPALIDNVEIRETQLFLLYSTGNVDKMQEECAKIPSEMSVQIIRNLQESEAEQSLCVMIAQTFLVQNWVRGLSADSGTRILLKLWIRLQYLVDGDLDKFSESIWAIAKLSQHTEQITFLVGALQEEAGDTFLQLNTNLCIYAFNLDKGCLEQAVADKDMELILCRNVALSKTSQMIMKLYHDTCPKLAKLSAVTAFSLDPSEENFEIIYTIFHSISVGSLSSNSITSPHEDDLNESDSPTNKLVNKLTSMLESLHMSQTKEIKRLRPKTKSERNRHSMSHRTVENVEYCGLSVNPATLYEVERLLNNICPFHLDVELNFTDLQTVCLEHLTRHQEMLMVLHEDSTDECSDYSSSDDEPADISGDLIDLPDNGASVLPSEVDNGTQKLDQGRIVAECEQEIGDAECICDPPVDVIGQTSCQSLFEASNVKCNTSKTAYHSSQGCPNNISSRNLFDAFNQDLSSKASSSQPEEPHHKTTEDAAKTSNTKEVGGYCASIPEKSARFPTCGASPSGSCRCDKSLSVHTCLSFDSQIDFTNMIDNTSTPSAAHTLPGMDKSSFNHNTKFHKMAVRDEHCCCCSNSLPNAVSDGNTVPVPTSLKCMCKIKVKSSKKSDKSSLKCDKKLQQVAESNNKESPSECSSSEVPSEDCSTNDKLLEKLKSCISAQTGSDSSQNVDEKFTLSKTEKSYIDRYCQFLKTVRQFEMVILTQKNCRAKQRRNYLVVYRCGICCEFFDNVSDLKEHIQSICKAAVMDVQNLTEAAAIFSTKDSVLSKIKFFKCLKCLQYTCTRREMDDHLRLCGVPLANKSSSKTADTATSVQKTESHKPSPVTSSNPLTSAGSLQTVENNNKPNMSLVKIESEPVSEVVNDSSQRLLVDEGGMTAEMACKKLDPPNVEMHPQVKCPEENVDKNIKPKATNEEYFKCQMCGRLLLGPHRHRLHLEACKKRCEWRKDRRLKRMSLAKPSEKIHPVIKKEISIPSPTTSTTISTSMSNNLPTDDANPSKDNLSDMAETKPDLKPKLPLPQPEKPKHCPECERIIKLRKVSQQLGISEKLLIKTEPQETPCLSASSRQHCSGSYQVMSEVDAAAIVAVAASTTATAAVVAATASTAAVVAATASTVATAAVVVAPSADIQMETTNTPAFKDNLNTDECIKRTMLQIKSEMENKQIMEKKAELHFQRISNSVSSLVPSSSVHGDVTCRNQLSVTSDCNVSTTTQNSDVSKCKINSTEEGQLRKKHGRNLSPYCRKCDFRFRDSSNFVKHLAITHLQPYTKEEITDSDSTTTVTFHCNFCQGAFQIWFKYINHIPNHTALILERLNCKLVEETYTLADETSLASGNDSTDSSDKHVKTNHSKSPLKKTYFKLVWPPPEEDLGTFFKRKRRRVTHKSRRTSRHNVPHPNPSLGNLSKTTIMNFTQVSSDADDNTNKEILHVMNDLLQKIVGIGEHAHNIMDVGSMPKSVMKKKKTVSLPVNCISSSCQSSIPSSDATAPVAVTIPRPQVPGQPCAKEMTANVSTCAPLQETAPIVPEMVLKTQQKCEPSTVSTASSYSSSLCCSFQKAKTISPEGKKMSAMSIPPHSSKNSCSTYCCVKPVNIPHKTENICSFNKVDTSLKDSTAKTSFESCSKNISFPDRGLHLPPSHDERKDNSPQLKKVCKVKPDYLEDEPKDNSKTESSLISQQVATTKKTDFGETTTKTVQDQPRSTCLQSSCRPSFPHSSCIVPVVSTSSSILSSDTSSAASPLLSNPASISKKPTSPTSVSLTMTPATTISTPATLESLPTAISKSASDSASLFTSSAAASPSCTALKSTCTHISKPLINASAAANVPSTTSNPFSTAPTNNSSVQNPKSDSSNFTLTKSSASSITPSVTLQSTFTDDSVTDVSSSLSLSPNPLSSVPPHSVSTPNLPLSSAPPSKSDLTVTSTIQMCQSFTTGPTPLAAVTITSSLPTIAEPISASNDAPSPPSVDLNMGASTSITTPPDTNLSTVSVSSLRAPILSTCSSIKSASISASSSTPNVALAKLYSPDNKTELPRSKSIAPEADISQTSKSNTLSKNVSKVTESRSNVDPMTTTDVNTSEAIKSVVSANLTLSSTTGMFNHVMTTTAATKSTSALNIVSTETVSTDLITTATTKSAGLNTTTCTVCPVMQSSNMDLVSLQSSTVPNMVFTPPFDVSPMQNTRDSSQENHKYSSGAQSTTVPIQLPSISDNDICSINDLPLISEVNPNATTTVSACSTPVVKTSPSNVCTNTTITSTTSKVPTSNISTSASTSSNNSTASACTTSFQVPMSNISVSTSASSSPVVNTVAASLPSAAASESSITTVSSSNASATTGSKIAPSICTSKPCITSERDDARTAATSRVTASSSTSTAEGSTICVYKDSAAVSVATTSLSTTTSVVTSYPTVTVSSNQNVTSATETSTSIAASIVSSVAAKSSISAVKPSLSKLSGSASSNTKPAASKDATTVAISKTFTTPTITSAVCANTTKIETLKLSSTISKSTISDTKTEAGPTVLPVDSSSEVIQSSLNAKPLVCCTGNSSQETRPTFSCTTTAVKTSENSTDKTESIVTSCCSVTTPLSTSTCNPSCTLTTASPISSTSLTCVTSASTAIEQHSNMSGNDQIMAPIPEMPNLAVNGVSSRITNSEPSLAEETSAIKTEPVHCSSKDSLCKLDDCYKVCCTSEVETLNAKPVEEGKSMVPSLLKDCEISDNDEKVIEPNTSCQFKTSLHSSHPDMQLNNAEDPCSSTPPGEMESNKIDSASVFCEKKSSNCVDYTKNIVCTKEAETTGCDVKLSASYENMSCNLANPTCKADTVTSREDEPGSSSEDCKFGYNQESMEKCEKELYRNDGRIECKEIADNSSDEMQAGLICKEPQTSPSNEDVVESSREHIDENVKNDKNSSTVENPVEKCREITVIKSEILTDSDEQCKNQCLVNEALETSSEVDDGRENVKSECPDKEKIRSSRSKEPSRPRGRPRKSNSNSNSKSELLLSSVASRQKLLNPGNIINFRLRKDRPTLKTVKCNYCCCKKRCQISCVQNKCKCCIAEGTSACRCNLTETQLCNMQKVALSSSTMCLNCHRNNKRASRGSKRKRSPSPKAIRHHSNFHSPLRSSSVSNQKTLVNTRLQKMSNVPFKKKLANSPRKNLVGSPHKKSLTSSSHKKLTGGNLKKLSSDYRKQKKFLLTSNKNLAEKLPKESPIVSLKSESSSELLQDTQNVSNLVTRRTLRSRKSLDETTPVIKQLRRSKSEQKLDSCTDDISKKPTDLLSLDQPDATLINCKLSPQSVSLENKIKFPLPCFNNGKESHKVSPENHDKKFVGNRALKELRQRVKLGPFKWDLEESETGGRAHSMAEDSECTTSTTGDSTGIDLDPTSKDLKVSAKKSMHPSPSSMLSSPAASSLSLSSTPSATADDELLGTRVTPPIRTYSRTQSPPSRIRVGRTYSKASDYQALPPGVMPVMPIIDCLRPTSHSSASHLCDMPRVRVVRVDKKGNMFESREPYPLPRTPLDHDLSRSAVDEEKGSGHRWKLQRTKMKTDGYPFSFKKTRIQ